MSPKPHSNCVFVRKKITVDVVKSLHTGETCDAASVAEIVRLVRGQELAAIQLCMPLEMCGFNPKDMNKPLMEDNPVSLPKMTLSTAGRV